MIRWLVDHATTILLAVIVVFVAGTYSYVTLPREASPDIKIPVVLISTPYPGVSPKDVESLITIPLENELAGLQDVKEMTSTSAEGVSIVAIEFEPDVVIEDALQRVRDRVSQAEPDMPDDAEDTSIREIAFSDIPILIVTIAGDVDEDVLKRIGEDLQEEVARIPGVLEANVSGGLERQVRVEIDPLRLAHYGLSLDDVTGAISNENVNIPGGTVTTGDGNVLLRVPGEFTEARQVETVAIKRIGDRPVFVRDVATVAWGYEDRQTYARMNGETAVSLSVTKRAGANIVDVAEQVKQATAAASATWPEGVRYRVLSDASEFIGEMVSDLQNNIITALILVVTVILLFMGLRTSGFVALAIPLSMLTSFLVLQSLGFTLNMIVLFSLILALGMLVDNAIVVVENVYRHAEEGLPPRRAAVIGTKEVAMAVAASTATTVAAFFPLSFWPGIMGEFMGFLPKTLIIVLISSLVVAVGVLPVAMSRLLRERRTPKEAPAAPADPGDVPEPAPVRAPGRVMAAYQWLLELSIRHRYWSATLGVVSLVATFAIYAVFNHGTEFFPETDPDRVTVRIEAPDGTDVETTDRIVRRVEALLFAETNVDVFVSQVGVSSSSDGFSQSAQANEARISVDFLPTRNAAKPGERVRVEPTPVTVSRMRAAVATIPGVRIAIAPEEMGPPVGEAIAVQVSGEDYHAVGAFAQQFRRELAGIPGVTDLKDDYRVGRPELRLRIDRAAAKRVGVSSAEIGNTVRTAVAGTKASALRDGEEEYDIVVRAAPQYREDLPAVLNLRIPGRVDTSPDTFPVPLSSVADYEFAGGTGAIRHVDQDLVVTITGDVLAGFNENVARQQVQDLIDRTGSGPLHVQMAGADDAQAEAAAFLFRTLFIALALILMVLVTQFDSLAMPIIIIASVVLSLIGVLWGLLLTGTSFGIIMTGIGVISLAGVVVNNAIVLLDYVQQLRKQGMGTHEALVRAGITRFRPVMLTAITTILGLAPMALGVSLDFSRMRVLIGGSSTQFWGPMAVAVIFGLAFATLLTLVMVPTLYTILEDLAQARAWVWGKLSRRRVAVAAKLLPFALVLAWAAPAQAATLADAVQAAEEHNLDLAIARERTRETGTMRAQAWTLVQPQIRANAGYNINEFEILFDPSAMIPEEFASVAGESEPIVVQEKTYWTASATVSQPLFNASALPLLRGAYALTDAARLDEESQRHRILAGVARAYYGLAVTRQNVVLAESSRDTRADQLDLAERQVAAGVAPRRAVLQAELALSRAKREVARAREDVVHAEETFSRLTGLPRDTEVTLPDPLEPPEDLEDALQVGFQRRPDLQAAERRVQAAALDKRAVTYEWLPEVDANFTYSYSQNTGFSDDPTVWVASIQANWLLWDGGLRQARSRERLARHRIAGFTAEKQRDQAEEELRTSWERYRRSEAALDAVQDEVVLSEENLELAERGFSAGTTTWLEVQDAELGVRLSKLSQITERMNRDLAVIDLMVAMGTPTI
jgi:multidrug efflux pump subunit AcrB